MGSVMTLYLDFYLMCFGRVIFGIASGVLLCTTSKYIDETVPAKVLDKGFGTSTNIIINIGMFALMMMAMGMPEES